jgi:DNA-binding HxlR family transcriptional regulator
MKIDNKEYRLEIGDKQYHCAMDVTMDYVGGKWKTALLWYLRNEKKRFTDLKNHIPQITERMLSITLKQLEEDDIISRKVFTDKPPLKVEYELTKFGKTLLPLLEAIALWGRSTAKSKGKLVAVK